MSGREQPRDDLALAEVLPPPLGAATRQVAGALVRCALRGEVAQAGPHLLVRAPGVAPRAVALPSELTLGRGPEASLLLDDPGVSRLHARLRLAEDGAAEVEDLGSKNGLQLNARRLPPGPVALRPGDELTVGETAIRFVDPLASAQAGPSPAASPRTTVDSGPGGPAAHLPPGQGLDAPRGPAGRLALPTWLLLAGSAALLALATTLLALE